MTLWVTDAIGLALVALLVWYLTGDPMKTEPAVLVGLIQAVVVAVVALVTAFGVDLTPGQTASVLGVTAAILALGLAFVTRSQVSPKSQ